MNIDERLEALTQSVELLASLHKDNEKRMAQLTASDEKLVRVTTRLSERHAQLEEALHSLTDGTKRLLRSSRTKNQQSRSEAPTRTAKITIALA
jgi:peptidoglycan hydrolase CwlO-like protein